MQSWKLKFGNKAIILSLDAFLAVLILMIMITASSLYLITSEKDKLTKLELVRAGSDIITILEYQDLFNEFGDLSDAQSKLNSIIYSQFQNYRKKIQAS